MYKINDVVTYRNQDGLAKIQLLKPTIKILGFQIWSARVLEVSKAATFGGNPKVGQTKQISERWFNGEV